jgi:hypothetical protein
MSRRTRPWPRRNRLQSKDDFGGKDYVLHRTPCAATRFGARFPADTRRHKIWLLFGIAASEMLTVFGMIALAWIGH